MTAAYAIYTGSERIWDGGTSSFLDAYVPHGAALDLWNTKASEIILSGPYETGKTLACLQKLNALLAKYPNSVALMVRKTYSSIVNTAVATYERKVLPYPPGHPKCGVQKIGGIYPSLYLYPNGSRIILGGLDNPDKVLSGEYDFVYVNQAEELDLGDWEILVGRATGRAANAPYTQVIGDCNPSHPQHWILTRKALTLLTSKHEDNPTLWDDAKKRWTERGTRTMEILDSLTGVRYKRGRLGLWVAAEGQVYNFDHSIHMVKKSPVPKDWRRIISIDFGYNNPFVAQWFAMSPDDQLVLYREIYLSRHIVADHAATIIEATGDEVIEAVVADHDAEDRATLASVGINTIPALKAVTVGVQAVQDRLKPNDRGIPRLVFQRDTVIDRDEQLAEKHLPLSTVEEFATYVYPPGSSSASAKEAPVKKHDHGMDALRYAVMYFDGTNSRPADELPYPF